jgi:hypothetical protein
VARQDKLWIAGLKAVGGAIVATSAVRWMAVAVLDIPADFLPLDGPGPVIFFTAAAGIVAVGVYGLIRRFASRPERAYRWIAVGVLLVSFVPDLWLLSDGAAEVYSGATPAGVAVLMVLHVVAAAVIVPVLTLGRDTQEPTL